MITRERARELRAVIEGAVSAYDMEDSEALKVVELFPTWETLLAAGNAKEAVDELLDIFRRDREWNEGAAKAQLITIFDALKATDPIAQKGRRRLSC